MCIYMYVMKRNVGGNVHILKEQCEICRDVQQLVEFLLAAQNVVCLLIFFVMVQLKWTMTVRA